ncbi:lactate dehydrogenase [Candidatus Saccharibacteria bacterium]|nr:lactate dehydrogenase [Candidatus Saccharibacteria bacterium]
MKIIAYNTNQDETPYYNQFSRELGVEYVTTTSSLTEETVSLAEGCDALTDFLPDKSYTEEIVSRLSEYGIKYISLRTAGYDGVNPDLLARYNIKLSNVPAYSPAAIAEFTVALTLTLFRNLQIVLPRVKTQDFLRTGMVGKEIGKQTVGIIGTGKIGLETAKIFKGFGARVIAYDIFPDDTAREVVEYKNTLDELYAESDIISLHIPLLPGNRHLINSSTIAKMKDGVYIINTARGGHIEPESLLNALLTKKVAGAAFDVYDFRGHDIFGQGKEGEILTDSIFRELFSLPNVVITPHIAYNTDEALRNIVKISTENILEFMQTGDCKNRILMLKSN